VSTQLQLTNISISISISIILGASIHTTKENTETLIVTGKETGLEVTGVKTKCMAVSQEQQAGQNHNIQISNKIL
jgi:hypothetical protein